jgi:probable phosphoglycerate mutase
VHNALGEISTGPPGGPLSDLGIAQSARLASQLAACAVAAIYSSPLERARRTAEILAKPHSVPIVVCPELTEVSAGELDGRSDAGAYSILNHALDDWCSGNLNARIGTNGETGHAMLRRLTDLVAELTARHSGQTVVLVSHGGLLQTGIPWLCTNLTPAFGAGRLLRNTAVIQLLADGTGVNCLSWDDTAVSAEAEKAEIAEKTDGTKLAEAQ